MIQRLPFGVSVDYMLHNSGTSYAVAALIVLLIAIVWAYSCQQYRSRAVRIMSGVLPRQVILQDFCTQLWHMISAALVSGCVVVLVVCCIHGWRDTGRFLTVFAQYALIFVLIAMFAIMMALLVLRPRVRIIAERSMPFSRMHGGNVVLCSVTAILTMLSLAVGIGAIAQHRATMRDLHLWQPLGGVVSADLSLFADEDYWQAHQDQLREAFVQLEDKHDLALSESVALFFTPSQGDMPTTEQIRQAVAPYDDVVVCNSTFLTMFQVPNDELSRVSISELTPQLRDNVIEYSKLWTVDGGASMGERLYRWTGDSAFPSLTYGQATGAMRQSRNPLIILIDEPARTLSLSGFLLPALSNGNLVFTSADSLRNTLQQYGVEELISSTSTIANAVYTRTVWLQTTIVGCATAVVICIIAMLSLLWFSAQTWSVEHSHLIFVRHTAGQRFSRIALHRVMMVAAALVLIMPLVMAILPQLSVVELADNTSMWLSVYVLTAIGFNAILTVLATRRRYFAMAHRE
ncbi:lantibiotic ABC transporter permease [Bifidobacterium pseudolongum subsp. globosum]|uniref:Lantibiotic ABC transporter permease n=2 Tax=Bifidobacterium pseudolongum TaxID=1694 RepID=A0A4Q5A0W7_9BIFI|nr:lantibiotic ABC transporter permease [Bifidobacterium pseudolongum subsp. globosum]